MLKRLNQQAAEALRTAFAPKSRGPLNSALRALARFAAACPERTLFKEPASGESKAASAHNEWTFVLFAMYMRNATSKKTKRPVSVKTVESYVSLLKGYLSFTYDFELVERAPRLKRLLAALRDGDPLHGMRRKRRGLRRRHLRRMWRRVPAVRATTPNAVNDWALLSTAWHVLARGGELAPQTSRWCPTKHPTRGDLSFGVTGGGVRYALLWLRPLKKKGKALAPKVPQYIREHDGGGSDTYAALRRLDEHDPVPHEERSTTPLFRRRTTDGTTRHVSVSMLRELVRARAKSIGYTVRSEWGAHSARIGGATDLASTGDASPLLLQARGRWASDIGRIYARMTRRCQLAASGLMQKARGRDLEELLPEFVQQV